MEMHRKVVQIVCSQHGYVADEYFEDTKDHKSLFALCDDGTIWSYSFSSKTWVVLPCIPQHKTSADVLFKQPENK